jgi:hypothetical protein
MSPSAGHQADDASVEGVDVHDPHDVLRCGHRDQVEGWWLIQGQPDLLPPAAPPQALALRMWCVPRTGVMPRSALLAKAAGYACLLHEAAPAFPAAGAFGDRFTGD